MDYDGEEKDIGDLFFRNIINPFRYPAVTVLIFSDVKGEIVEFSDDPSGQGQLFPIK